MAHSNNDNNIPEFSGDVAKYRDWKRAMHVHHAGVQEDKRYLTAARVLGRLRGAARLATRHLDPEALREKGQDGLEELLNMLVV